MTVTSIMISEGMIVGAVVEANGIKKNARLADLKKLYAAKKIESGCKVINDQVYFSPDVLNNVFQYEKHKFTRFEYDENGKATHAIIDDNHQIDLNRLWLLAANHIVDDVVAAYDRPTASKILQTV